jgi:MFS transporter, PPP family, 3-phenylpropionic acid transporter
VSRRPGRAAGLVVLLFVVNGVVNAVFMPFAPAVLVGRGLSATWLGLVAAAVSLLYVGVAGLWGHLADVVLGRGRALALAMGLSAGMLAIFAMPLPITAIGLAYLAFASVYGLLFPLQDALAVNALASPERQYGPVRALQSASFAVATIIAGAAYEVTGYSAAVPVFVALAIPAVLIALVMPDVARARLASARRGGAVREALAVRPALRRVLVAFGLANIGVYAAFTFLPLLIVRLGGASGTIGLAIGLTAAVEVVAMPLVSRLLTVFGLRPVVACSFAVLAVVFAWLAVAPTPEHVIAASVVYGFGWSGMWVGGVATIRALLPPTLQGSGQSLLSLSTAGAAAFIANTGGGLLWAGPGPVVVFGIAAAAAVAGVAVGWFSLPRRDDAEAGASPVTA